MVFKRITQTEYTKLDEIKHVLLHNRFMNVIRHIFRFINRLPKYLKLAWTNEAWDFEYLYDLIEMKLKEFKKAQEEDTWHCNSQRYVKQIDITLKRLDRFRNWPNYYYYPMWDIVHKQLDTSGYQMIHTNELNEQRRLNAHKFEEKNYKKFWKDLERWHRDWWT